MEPGRVDLAGIVDAIGRAGAGFEGDLDQPDGVRRVRRSDDEYQLGLRGDLLDRDLAVLRRVADVVAGWADQTGEPFTQLRHGLVGLVDRQGRLGQPDDPVRIPHLHVVDVRWALHELDVLRSLPEVPSTSSCPS